MGKQPMLSLEDVQKKTEAASIANCCPVNVNVYLLHCCLQAWEVVLLVYVKNEEG